jgi:hypothetical protein
MRELSDFKMKCSILGREKANRKNCLVIAGDIASRK